MELFYSVTINLIFYTTIILLFLYLIFFFIGISRRLFLNCLSMLLIVTPLFLRYNRIVDIITFSFTTMIGLCIYPITLSLMIKHQYDKYRQTPVIPVYVISAASFFSLMILPDYSILIIYLMHLLFYLYIIYIIFP